MNVRVLALHVACEACGDTQRCTHAEQQADWWAAHFLPFFTQAEVLYQGRLRYLPVKTS